MLLSIDTSRDACSVALFDGISADERTSHEPRSHAKLVAPFAADLLCSLDGGCLRGIVVVAGPGSYTGLRIGMASAKGLCVALNTPLYAVSTLEVMAYAAVAGEAVDPCKEHAASMVISRFQARQGEWYMGAYRMRRVTHGSPPIPERVTPDAVVPENLVVSWISSHVREETYLETEAEAGAVWAARLVHAAPHAYLQDDAFTLEPYYLKDVAVRPRSSSVFDRLPFGGS